MSLIKSFIAVIVASILLAGGVSASSIYTAHQNVNSHSLSYQMTNVVTKNKETIDYQLNKQKAYIIRPAILSWSFISKQLDQS